MPRKRRILFILVGGVGAITIALITYFLIGRSRHVIPAVAWNALRNADRYEVFAIQPDVTAGGLDRYAVVNKVQVVDPKTQSLLNDALEQAAGKSKGWKALCFEPHHGIRVTRGPVTTDFIICFKCMQVQVWQGENYVAGFATDASAEPAFDQVLTPGGVAAVKR